MKKDKNPCRRDIQKHTGPIKLKQYVLDQLSPAERRDIDDHLHICHDCRSKKEEVERKIVAKMV
jgi:anti-sigma factor RsiW